MGGNRKAKPYIGVDGRVPLTVRLLPEMRERLYARADKDGMTLSRLIDSLLEFGLKETETVLVRRQEKDYKRHI